MNAIPTVHLNPYPLDFSSNHNELESSLVRRSPAPGWFSSNSNITQGKGKSYVSKLASKVGFSSRSKKQEFSTEPASGVKLGNYFYGPDWKPDNGKNLHTQASGKKDHIETSTSTSKIESQSPPRKGMLGKLIYGDDWEAPGYSGKEQSVEKEGEKVSTDRLDSMPAFSDSMQKASFEYLLPTSNSVETISEPSKSSIPTRDSKKSEKKVRWKEDGELKRVHEYIPSSDAPVRTKILSKMKSSKSGAAENPEFKKANSWNGQTYGGESFRWSHTGLEPVESTGMSTTAEREPSIKAFAKEKGESQQGEINKGKKVAVEHLPESSRTGESRSKVSFPTSHHGHEAIFSTSSEEIASSAIRPDEPQQGSKKNGSNWIKHIKNKMVKKFRKKKAEQEPTPNIDVYQQPPYTYVLARANDLEVLESKAQVHAKDREPTRYDWWKARRQAQALAEQAGIPWEQYAKDMKWNIKENPFNVKDHSASPSSTRNSPLRSSSSTPQSLWTPTTFSGFRGQVISSSPEPSVSQKSLFSSETAPFSSTQTSPSNLGQLEINEVQSPEYYSATSSPLGNWPVSPVNGVQSKEKKQFDISSQEGKMKMLDHLSNQKEKEWQAANKKVKRKDLSYGQVPKQKENPFMKDVMHPEHQQRLRDEWMKKYLVEKEAKESERTKERTFKEQQETKERNSTPEPTLPQYVDNFHFMDSLWAEELEAGRAREAEQEKKEKGKKKSNRSWNPFKRKKSSKAKMEDDSSSTNKSS